MAVSNIFGRDFYYGTAAEAATTTPRTDGALYWATDTLTLYCYSGAAWNVVGGGGAILINHDHSGDVGDGGTFDAANLTSGASGDGDVLTSDGAGGAAWEAVAAGDVATDAIWDAKGDLAAGTGANTASKLAVGTDGKYLKADSGQATGLIWDVLANHDHSGDAGDGGTFDAANLTAGASTDGQVLTSDGAGGAAWEDPAAGSGDVATDTIWDAKGDLAAGTGANTASKLAVGTDGKYLKADSGQATGLIWDVLANHDHSGDAGDGGTFDAANLTSGASTDGQVLTSDGAGGAAWEDVAAGGFLDANEVGEIPYGTPPTVPVSGSVLIYADYLPSDTNSIPQMTSDSAPSGVCSASSYYATTPVWHAFDNTGTKNGWITNGTSTGWIKYEFPSSKRIVRYSIRAWWADNFPGRCPKTWTFQGSTNDTDWDTLDTVAEQIWTFSNYYYIFDIADNFNSYTYYKLDVTANWGNAYLGIGGMKMFEPGSVLGLYAMDDGGGVSHL